MVQIKPSENEVVIGDWLTLDGVVSRPAPSGRVMFRATKVARFVPKPQTLQISLQSCVDLLHTTSR